MPVTGKIVVFVPFIDAFGGVERQVLDLSRFLHDAGKPHTILCLGCSIDLASHADRPIDLHVLAPPRNPIAEGYALARYFRDPAHSAVQAPLFFDLKGAFYAGLFRLPDFHLHLTDPPSLLPKDVSKFAWSMRGAFKNANRERPAIGIALRGEIVHRIVKRGVRRARSVIATTRANANEIAVRYAKPAVVIHPGVQPPHGQFQVGGGGLDRLRFLSVSRLEESKRIDWMLRAFAAIEASQDPLSATADWRLDVVGDGPQRDSLRALASGLGLADRVVFHGRVSDAQLDELYAKASVFLMPAVQGYGLPALESLLRRVPVVLHRDSGVSELLNAPPWVELVERDADDLAQAIRRMVAHIASGALRSVPVPSVPLADDWAKKIVAVCAWS